jgi:hypothetical protein
MPYFLCPACGLRAYSAAGESRCPACDVPMGTGNQLRDPVTVAEPLASARRRPDSGGARRFGGTIEDALPAGTQR